MFIGLVFTKHNHCLSRTYLKCLQYNLCTRYNLFTPRSNLYVVVSTRQLGPGSAGALPHRAVLSATAVFELAVFGDGELCGIGG